MAGRRKHEEEHENHERWLVSYADFITLLFAFFVVMYAISSVNEGKYRVLSNSIVNAFRSVDTNTDGMQVVPLTSVKATLPMPRPSSPKQDAERQSQRLKMQNMAEQVRRLLAPLVENGSVSINDGPYGISIEINASALFNPGEALISAEAGKALFAVGQVLAQGEFPVRVEGHTDTIPIASFQYPSNWELSSARASTIVRTFIAAGVDARRLTAVGMADQKPVADNSTLDGRSRNRRVSILVESILPPEASAGAQQAVTAGAGSLLGTELPRR